MLYSLQTMVLLLLILQASIDLHVEVKAINLMDATA
jgi:hypothetical protein